MRDDNTISKENKTNYDINIFKVIETFGYNGAVMVETLCALDLYIFMPYTLKVPLLIKKCHGIFSRFLKGTATTQFKEAIWDCQNQVLKEYNDKSTREISGSKRKNSVSTYKKKWKTLFLRK